MLQFTENLQAGLAVAANLVAGKLDTTSACAYLLLAPILNFVALLHSPLQIRYLVLARCVQAILDNVLLAQVCSTFSAPLHLASFCVHGVLLSASVYLMLGVKPSAGGGANGTAKQDSIPTAAKLEPGAPSHEDADSSLGALAATDSSTYSTHSSKTWESTLAHLFRTARTTNWDKKPVNEMNDDEFLAFRHIALYGNPEEDQRALTEIFNVQLSIPDADPDMLPEDASERLKREFGAHFPGYRLLSVTFHRGCLLANMKLICMQAGTFDAESFKAHLKSLPVSTWLDWLRLPPQSASDVILACNLGKERDPLTAALPDVVRVEQPESNVEPGCLQLLVPRVIDSKASLICAGMGMQPLPTVLDAGGTSRSDVGDGWRLRVEGFDLQSASSPCRLLNVATYNPTSHAAKSAHDIILLPPGWVEEELELQQLCDPAASPSIAAHLSSPSARRELAQSWAQWMQVMHADGPGFENNDMGVPIGERTSETISLDAWMKAGAVILKGLIQARSPVLAGRILKVMLQTEGARGSRYIDEVYRGSSVLHHVVMSGSTGMVDLVHEHVNQLGCSWGAQDSRGLSPLHLAVMMGPNIGMALHLLSKNDPNIHSAWLEKTACCLSPEQMAELIARVGPYEVPTAPILDGVQAFSVVMSAEASNDSSASGLLKLGPEEGMQYLLPVQRAAECTDFPSATELSAGSSLGAQDLAQQQPGGMQSSNGPCMSLVPVCMYMGWKFRSGDDEREYTLGRAAFGKLQEFYRDILATGLITAVLIRHRHMITVLSACVLVIQVSVACLSLLGTTSAGSQQLKKHIKVVCAYTYWSSVVGRGLAHGELFSILAGLLYIVAATQTKRLHCLLQHHRALLSITGCLLGCLDNWINNQPLSPIELAGVWAVVGCGCVCASVADYRARLTFLQTVSVNQKRK